MILHNNSLKIKHNPKHKIKMAFKYFYLTFCYPIKSLGFEIFLFDFMSILIKIIGLCVKNRRERKIIKRKKIGLSPNEPELTCLGLA
jgi:hypothetical protein